MKNFILTPKRLYYIMLASLILLTVLAIGGAVIGNVLLQKQSQHLRDMKLRREVLSEQKIALDQAKQDLEEYAELEQIAKQVVPQEKDQVRTVREIAKFAEESGINLSAIGFAESELGEPTASNVNLTQLEQVEGLNNVYGMEIMLSTGSPAQFAQLVDFLERLESNRRTSQISTIEISPDTENRSLLSFNITLNVYIKP